MKVWKATLLIGTSNEYSQVQINGLKEWFEEFEKRFQDDFSYIRLKIGKPKFAGMMNPSLDESAYPEQVKDWQKEADSMLENCLEEQ